MPPQPIFLVDNGSLRPSATFALRELAEALSQKTDRTIEAVSLLHSHKISPELLGGEPATIVKRRMRERIKAGQREFTILPLFLGPSLAITDYLPSIAGELCQTCPELKVNVAPPIAGDDVATPDRRLASILADQVQPLIAEGQEDELALVDHGTPIRPVNRLRNAVARQLAEELDRPVQPCSMERRDGPDYAFNEPLLENLAFAPNGTAPRLVLAMFFLLPGRHAGEEGDVAEIAENLVRRGVVESVRISPLLAEHPLLLDILADRLGQARPAKNRPAE
jgi:hypothetical protein